MRFRSLAAALIIAPALAHAQTAPVNPANLPLVTQTLPGVVPPMGTATGKLLNDSGAWSSTITAPAITGGTMDGTAIGATTPAGAKFTTLATSGVATLSGQVTINYPGVGLTVTNATQLNNLTASGTVSLAGPITIGPASGGTFINNQAGNTGGINYNVTATTACHNFNGAGTNIVSICGSVNSSTTVGNKLVLNPQPLATSTGPFNQGFFQNQTWTGNSGATALVLDQININDQMQTTAPGGISALAVSMTSNSANASGVRYVMSSSFSLTATSGNTTGLGAIYTALGTIGRASVNDNGVNDANWGHPQGGKGAITVFNPSVLYTSGATFFRGISAAEFDIGLSAGSSANSKQGIILVQTGTDRVQGAWLDAAFLIANQTVQATGQGWKNGIMFGNDSGAFPMDPLGTLIGAGGQVAGGAFNGQQAGYGIDWRLPTFSGALVRSRQFIVDGAGTEWHGSGAVAYTGSGMSLDVNYLHGLAEAAAISGAAIVSAGTSGFVAGDLLYDAFNGVYRVTAATGGVITGISVVRQSFAPVGTSATVTLTNTGTSLGLGTVQITQTWTTDTTLALQPSGGLITVGGTAAVTCPTGAPTASFATKAGIVTHC